MYTEASKTATDAQNCTALVRLDGALEKFNKLNDDLKKFLDSKKLKNGAPQRLSYNEIARNSGFNDGMKNISISQAKGGLNNGYNKMIGA